MKIGFVSVLVVALVCFVYEASACTAASECGTTDQEGQCINNVCACGVGFFGGSDPTTCALFCTPVPIADSVAFLDEPIVEVAATAGNLQVILSHPSYAKQDVSSFALRSPSTNAACSLYPSLLGNGETIQGVYVDAGGVCSQNLTFARNFAAIVQEACVDTLTPSTENNPQSSITFNRYATVVEYIQTALAPFGQTASRDTKQDETTITRIFRREYQLAVGTSFTPSSDVFSTVAEGNIRYRLVIIEYDLFNNVIRATVETDSPDTAKLVATELDLVASTGLAPQFGTIVVGDCEANSAAGRCTQFHVIEFSLDAETCNVANGNMVLQVELQCTDGSDPATCGFTNLPPNNEYSLTNLLLNYDACTRVIEYGVDAATSFLRLHEDTPRANALSAPGLIGDTYYGRASLEPSGAGDARFETVTLESINIIQVASPTNTDLGDQMPSTFLTVVSPLTSNDPLNPIWDFDLTLDDAFFDPLNTYFLQATFALVFENTGPLTRSVSLGSAFKGSDLVYRNKQSGAKSARGLGARQGDASTEDGVRSSTFRMTDPRAADTDEEEVTDNSGMLIGIGVGVGLVVIAAVVIVIVVVVMKKKKKREEAQKNPLSLDDMM